MTLELPLEIHSLTNTIKVCDVRLGKATRKHLSKQSYAPLTTNWLSKRFPRWCFSEKKWVYYKSFNRFNAFNFTLLSLLAYGTTRPVTSSQILIDNLSTITSLAHVKRWRLMKMKSSPVPKKIISSYNIINGALV